MDWSLPYPANRSPLCAANLVATSQPLATQAGLQALRIGGNAVDAALAAAITLTVVEPNNNGLGSDAFALVWDGARLQGLNGSGRAPTGWTPERFSGRQRMPGRGWDSVTVPGAVSAWVALAERFGRLPFPRLFDDAIHYAERGFQVGPKSAPYWQAALADFRDYPDFQRHFGPAPETGARFRRPDLARTLTDIAETRGATFYQGELAAHMADTAAAAGGALTREDLAAHRCDWVSPLTLSYRTRQAHELPPNGQGLAALIALGLLRERDLPGPDQAEAVHLQIEAVKIALRAAFDHIADPAAMQRAPESLLNDAVLRRAADGIGAQASRLPPAALPASADTVYLCAADADGLMVSFIQSNYQGFGSGIVIPGTGIALQNRGAGFTLQPGHPNEVGPGKRPFHTIIPGFVTDAEGARLAFGVMGGHMQAQGHVQMLVRLFDWQQNPQAASDAPRWHVYPDFSVGLERGFPEAIARDLATRGHRVRYDPNEATFGGAQLILRTPHGYVGGSDHRKEGQAAGF